MLQRNAALPEDLSLSHLILRPINAFRLYYTHTGLVCAFLLGICVLRPRSRLAHALLPVDQRDTAFRVLMIGGGAALAYVLAAPSWAAAHVYWQFYALPYVAFSLVASCVFLYVKASRPGARAWKALLLVAAIEMVATTAYTLNLRYSKTDAYAIRQTAIFEASYLDASDDFRAIQQLLRPRTRDR